MSDRSVFVTSPGTPQWVSRATVTQLSPLRIQLEHDGAALPITPEADCVGLAVNDIVLARFDGQRVIVHTRTATPAYVAAAGVSTATANTVVRRDAAGRFQAATPSATGDVATKAYADGLGVDTPTASTIVRRDAAGRFAAATPSATDDVATKAYADGLGVSTATASTIVRRDAAGRFAAATPSASGDVATKGYVDGLAASAGEATPTYASGYSDQSGYEVHFEKFGRTVVAEGLAIRTAGAWAASANYTGVFTIPTGYRPKYEIVVPAAASYGYGNASWFIHTTGVVDLRVGPNAISGWVSIGGNSWVTP